MIKTIFNFLMRIILCTFSFHSKADVVQSTKQYHEYSCGRCGTMFRVRNSKYK